MPFWRHFYSFSSLLTTLLHSDTFVCMIKSQSWFRVTQRWISVVQRRKPDISEVKNKFWTALTQRKSQVISSKTALISTDVFHVFWISAENFKYLKQHGSSALLVWRFRFWIVSDIFQHLWRFFFQWFFYEGVDFFAIDLGEGKAQ